MKKLDNERTKVDLEAHLVKTIQEYEDMLNLTEEEQQKRKIGKLLQQMRKELK